MSLWLLEAQGQELVLDRLEIRSEEHGDCNRLRADALGGHPVRGSLPWRGDLQLDFLHRRICFARQQGEGDARLRLIRVEDRRKGPGDGFGQLAADSRTQELVDHRLAVLQPEFRQLLGDLVVDLVGGADLGPETRSLIELVSSFPHGRQKQKTKRFTISGGDRSVFDFVGLLEAHSSSKLTVVFEPSYDTQE